MLSPLPRRSDWASSLLIHPVVSAFPDRVAGSACASSFSRFARRSLALRAAHSRCHLFVTRITRGFSHFVTSMTAPVASGWSGCRAGLAPAGKRRLFTAHTLNGPWTRRCQIGRFRKGTTAVPPSKRPARHSPYAIPRFTLLLKRSFRSSHGRSRTERPCANAQSRAIVESPLLRAQRPVNGHTCLHSCVKQARPAIKT
jgi:hypothetical protein